MELSGFSEAEFASALRDGNYQKVKGMRNSILDTAEDMQWLREGYLKGVPLMSEFTSFRFAILQGNEDAPYAINLYLSDNPAFNDDYLRVTFNHASPIYCEMQPFCGKTDKPKGGA